MFNQECSNDSVKLWKMSCDTFRAKIIKKRTQTQYFTSSAVLSILRLRMSLCLYFVFSLDLCLCLCASENQPVLSIRFQAARASTWKQFRNHTQRTPGFRSVSNSIGDVLRTITKDPRTSLSTKIPSRVARDFDSVLKSSLQVVLLHNYQISQKWSAFLLCASIANGIDLTSGKYEQHWQQWKSFYGKTYESEVQDIARFAVWKNNLQIR